MTDWKNSRLTDCFQLAGLPDWKFARSTAIGFARLSPIECKACSFGHVGWAAALLGHLLGPKWSQKHQDEGLKSDLGSSRGGQGVPEALNGSILGRCSSLVARYLVVWYVFCKKGFVHAVWYLDLDS